jgi:redox-sensitive bicupin YhaK (pirin superfamily)
MTAPRYQDIKAGEIPEIVDDDGTRVRMVCGDFWGKRGPVEGVAADPRYLDISVPPGKRKTLPVELERHAFAYVFEGSGNFRAASQPFGVLTEKTDGANEILVREQTGNRSLVCSTAATRSRCRPATRHPLSAGLRQADRGAGRLVRPDRDEHPGRACSRRFRAAPCGTFIK